MLSCLDFGLVRGRLENCPASVAGLRVLNASLDRLRVFAALARYNALDAHVVGEESVAVAAAADLGDSHAAYQLEIVQRHLAVVEEFAQRVHVLRQPANLRDGAELALGLGDHERRRRLSQ